MRLQDVISGTGVPASAAGSLAVTGISIDSRTVRPGDLFVALRGARSDGHEFLGEAARAGAVAALVEREVADPPLPCLRVPSTTAALPAVAVAFHGDPSSRMTVLGVTGTNGKTTVTYLLESILSAAGCRTAVLGTVNYRLAGEILRTGLTTPFPHELQEVLARALAGGASHFVMEVSSHSTDQGRIEGVRFDAGMFTNLSHDHLDYHGDMESYFSAKARFFREYLPKGGKRWRMAVNGDDPYGARLAREFPGAWTYGFSPDRSVHPVSAEVAWEGSRLDLATPAGPLSVRTPLIGSHNASNVMAAVCGGLLLDLPPSAIRDGVRSLETIPGRLERIPNDRGIHIFVDYAHTPDGLDRLLAALRELAPGRLLTVFGCGGNRDRTKRPAMGRVAARWSDRVIVTSDNPRNEDPEAILREIVPGLRDAGSRQASPDADEEAGCYEVVPDRRSAIARAIDRARPGDTVAIAGKGHENVQILRDRCLPFDDREVVRAILAGGG